MLVFRHPGVGPPRAGRESLVAVLALCSVVLPSLGVGVASGTPAGVPTVSPPTLLAAGALGPGSLPHPGNPVVSGRVVANVNGYGVPPVMAGANVTAFNAMCTTLRPLPETCPVVTWTTTNASAGFALPVPDGAYYITVHPDPAITGGAYPYGFGGNSALVHVSADTQVNLTVYPLVPYDNATLVLPGYVCDYQYLNDVGTGGPGCQNPLLSWTQDGAYYLNATNELVFYSFANQTVYGIAPWTPLYQRFPGYSMIPNELFITQDGTYIYGWGTLTPLGSAVTAEAVNVTTGRGFLYTFSGVTTADVASNGQVQLTGWDGNDSQLTLIVENGSIYDHDLWASGQSLVARLSFFEGNNVYWEPYLNGYVNVEAEGSTLDGVEEWQLSGPTSHNLTRTFHGEWGHGRTIQGVNGIALNLTNGTLSFAVGAGGAGNSVVADFNDGGTITRFAAVIEAPPTEQQLGPGAASDRPSLLSTGPALQDYFEGLYNYSWLVQLTPGHLGYETTNLSGVYAYGGSPPGYGWSQWSQEGQFYNASYLIAPNSYACDQQFSDACTINGTGGVAVGTIWWYWRTGAPEFPFPAAAPMAELTPPPPTSVTVASVTPVTMGLDWSTAGGPPVDYYTVDWGTSPSYGQSVGLPGSTHSYTLTGLPSDTRIYFSVEAWNLHYHGISEGASYGATGGPPAPTGLALVTSTPTTLRWAWTQSSGLGILNDTLFLFGGGSCAGLPQPHSTGGAAGSEQVEALPPATVYSAYVTAWNASGESSPSACASGATLPAGATVTFAESGLPTEDWWYVNVTGGPRLNASAAAPLLTVNLLAGSYRFAVATNDKRFAPSYSPVFVVNVTPFTVPLTFSPYTYPISVSAGGLPAGTLWSVTVGTDRRTTSTNPLVFNETNGTYPYSISDLPGWHQRTLPYGGSLEVQGAPVAMPTLEFTRETYSVTILETGLPGGTIWPVFVNQTPYTSTGVSVVVVLPNGTYPFRMGPVAGFHVAPTNGTIEVAGTNLTVLVSFARNPTGTTWWVWAEVGAGAAVATGAGVLLVRRRRRRLAPSPARPAAEPPRGTS